MSLTTPNIGGGSPSPRDAAVEEVALTSGGRRISAHLAHPRGRVPSGAGLLFVHGLHSDQAGYLSRAEAASSQLGAICLSFDLAGHGESAGTLDELSPRDHLHDVVASYDHLAAAEGVDPSRIGVCAASYGAYLAGLLIAEYPVRRALLRAPALYDESELDSPLRGGRRSDAEAHAPSVFKALAGLGSSLLVLESGRDDLIPHEVVEAYLSACPEAAHRVIPDATHALTDPAWRQVFVATILDWFEPL